MKSNSPRPLVCAVVVNWNRKQDTLECVKSVLASSYAPLEVIIVDNASTDGSVAEFRRTFPPKRVSLIVNKSNEGYVANNRGIESALRMGANYVFILNNDTVVDKDAVKFLVEAAQEGEGTAIAAPLIVYAHAPKTVWCAGALFNRLIFKASLMGVGRPASQYAAREEIPLAVGAAMLVKGSAIEKTGVLLDESYFAYCEETKWELQMREKGFSFVLEPKARVVHAVAASSGGMESPISAYYLVRNRGFLINDLCPTHLKPIAYAWLAGEVVARIAKYVFKGRAENAAMSVRGFLDFARGKRGKLGN